jgi:ABC-type dipeptide/oligopeptide/nickel transport system ATPase component
MLTVDNLTLYTIENSNKLYLLKDISFSLNQGDSLGIIGKSGDGKSTLAKALLKIYDKNIIVESGNIIINNQKFNENFRGKKIALIFQNPNSYLNPLMKVGKQIDEMLIYHYKETKKSSKAKAIAIMKELGIDNAEEIYNYYPYEMSGGMQQKICLCIALICKPEIIILDESTSYLDSKSKNEILSLIKILQEKYKFTLLMISHDFKEIYTVCNKIAIMRKGQLIELGNKDEIILNPIHPYTIELLCDYLRYYQNSPSFLCPLMNIEISEVAPITTISLSHFVRSWYLDKSSLKLELPSNIEQIKEQIYENIRN